MLLKSHRIAYLDFARRRVRADRLTQRTHAQYVAFADRMLHVYQSGKGRTRQELHREIHQIFADEPDCPPRRIDAFCKLLDDVSTFDADRRGRSAQLRRQVFTLAGPYHPLVTSADHLFEYEESAVKERIATEIGVPWQDIEQRLFADVLEFQRLRTFAGFDTASDLLARYNVGQLQTLLFSAVDVTIRAQADFRILLQQAKLARLMHTLTRRENGYEIHLDGPASVLRQTRRYGVALAKFLPGLLACQDWIMRARIEVRRHGPYLDLILSSRDGYRATMEIPEFDSDVEARFAAAWGDQPREGWTLHREAVVLHQGQKSYVPDFVLRHADGREVLLEIVGFWTPEYLAAKARTLEGFRDQDILLAVSVAVANSHTLPIMRRSPIGYKTALSVDVVLKALTDQPGDGP